MNKLSIKPLPKTNKIENSVNSYTNVQFHTSKYGALYSAVVNKNLYLVDGKRY